MSPFQLAQRSPHLYPNAFEYLVAPSSDSFFQSIYQELLLNLSKKWQVNRTVLDFNLARLRHSAQLCLRQWQQQLRQEQLQLKPSLLSTATFTLEELPLALEIYLQFDGKASGLHSLKLIASFSRSILFQNVPLSVCPTHSNHTLLFDRT